MIVSGARRRAHSSQLETAREASTWLWEAARARLGIWPGGFRSGDDKWGWTNMTRFCKSCYLIFGSWFSKLKIWPGFPQVNLPHLDAEPEHFIMQGVSWLSVALIKHWTCTNLTIMMRFASGFNVNLGQEFSQKSVARAFSRHRWIYRVSQKRWLIEEKKS